MLSVWMKPPASADALRKNPLGLYVDAIDWAREVEPQEGGGSTVPGGSPPEPRPAAQYSIATRFRRNGQ